MKKKKKKANWRTLDLLQLGLMTSDDNPNHLHAKILSNSMRTLFYPRIHLIKVIKQKFGPKENIYPFMIKK
jgi:hypothetical protein